MLPSYSHSGRDFTEKRGFISSSERTNDREDLIGYAQIILFMSQRDFTIDME
jgi:hypothetical protein